MNTSSDSTPQRPRGDGPARLSWTELQFEPARLIEYGRILSKRRWVASSAFAIVLLSAAVHSFTAAPIFEARAKILIEADTPNVISFEQVIEETQSRADYYQTQYNVLLSRSLARKTLDALALWSHPALRPDVDHTVAAVAIDRLLAGLDVVPVRNSRIVDLTYRSPDAALAASVVNAHAKSYIRQNLEFRLLSSREASGWLAERLTEQRAQVEAAEVALQRYREANQAIAVDDTQNIVVQKLADLNTAVTRAKTVRIEKETLYNQLRAVSAEPAALDAFPAILSDSFIRQLKAELLTLKRQHGELMQKVGNRHPDLINLGAAVTQAETRLDQEVAKIASAVQHEFAAAEALEKSLTVALDAQKREALSMTRAAIEYGVLQREVESSRQVYQSLLQRANETGVSSELRTNNIRIVDEAEVPRLPVSPRIGRNIMLAAIGGMLLALVLVVGVEALDDRIKSPEEIRERFGLPFLGLVPEIPAAQQRGAPLVSSDVPAGFREALHVVQTNVLFSPFQPRGRSVLVTSAITNEGKTTVASNLAVGLAQLGARVILIDADLRRPRLHQLFGQAAEPGLTNVMVGKASLADAIRSTDVPGLSLLLAGRLPPNPVELVATAQFTDTLRRLTEDYEWVVLDSPPVMAVADTAVLARVTAGVLLVIGSEMSSRATVQAAIERLDAVGARVLGSVLNRVDLARDAYYYSRYYRAEYGLYHDPPPAESRA